MEQSTRNTRSSREHRNAFRVRLGIGVAAVAAMLGFGYANTVNHAAQSQKLTAELSKPYPEVESELQSGKINPDSVVKVTVKPGETTANQVAEDDAKPGDAAIVQGVIANQLPAVGYGEVAEVPRSMVKQ